MIHLDPKRGCATGRRGSALAISLAMVGAIALLSAMMLQITSAHWKRQAAAIDQKRAFYLAEAGLSEAILSIMLGGSGNVGSLKAPARFGDGLLYTETVQDEAGILRVDSTAMAGRGRYRLSAALEIVSNSALSLGAFGDRSVVIGAGAFIDSYDSTAGPYVAPDPDGAALIGTGGAGVGSNGMITVEGARGGRATTILGNVTPGPGGHVTIAPGALITGTTTPRRESFDLPELEVPALPSTGNYLLRPGREAILGPGEHSFDNFTVGSNGVLTIHGPATIVTGTLSLDSAAGLVINAEHGPVRIYVRDGMSTNRSSTIINLQQDPSLLTLNIGASYVDFDRDESDGSFELESRGDFHGVILAPTAAIEIPAHLVIYGAVVARDLTLAPSAQVHVDRSLGASDPSAMPNLDQISWRIVDLPRELATDLRFDALREAQRDGAEPLSPWASVQPIDWGILFEGHDGRTYLYRGTEEAFDWETVSRVLRQAERTAARIEDEVDPVVSPPLTRVVRRIL